VVLPQVPRRQADDDEAEGAVLEGVGEVQQGEGGEADEAERLTREETEISGHGQLAKVLNLKKYFAAMCQQVLNYELLQEDCVPAS
jgi:hypothetical protein